MDFLERRMKLDPRHSHVLQFFQLLHHLKNGVAFGACLPETENHMHGPNEFAVVDELLMSAKIFAQVIVDLCS